MSEPIILIASRIAMLERTGDPAYALDYFHARLAEAIDAAHPHLNESERVDLYHSELSHARRLV